MEIKVRESKTKILIIASLLVFSGVTPSAGSIADFNAESPTDSSAVSPAVPTGESSDGENSGIVELVESGDLVVPSSARSNSVSESMLCENVLLSTEGLLFPVQSASNRYGQHLQFGFESEYLLSEAGPLLQHYAPDPAVAGNPSHSDWMAWGPERRLEYIKSRFSYRPEFAESVGLKLFNSSPLIALPLELILDSTGNLELVFPPVDRISELETIIKTTAQLFGPGSQQTMTSVPANAFFAGNLSVNENLGFLNLINEADTFEKLNEGYQRFLKRPETLVARSFEHPFLGPMNRVKHAQLREYLNQNASGRGFDDEAKQFVRKSDASFKYISGTAYRPDIASPARVAFEERSSHKDVEAILAKTQRNSFFLSQDRSAFGKFASWDPFDTVATFESLPEDLRNLLMGLFPSKADPRFEYTQSEILSLEVYRNFAFPLRNFQSHIDLGTDDESQRVVMRRLVMSARTKYLQDLEAVSRRLASGQISRDQARVAVQGSLSRFASESKLSDFLQDLIERIRRDLELGSRLLGKQAG